MPNPRNLRLLKALQLAAPETQKAHRLIVDQAQQLVLAPGKLRAALETCTTRRVRVAGTLDRRLVFVERPDGRWAIGDLSGQSHATRCWPAWMDGHLHFEDPATWLSLARLDEYAVYRLSRPHVLLAALYHPEYFPLPRFPLGISDVARAARSTLMGEVQLADMQLGVNLDWLIKEATENTPDIIGVSATFGQHDLMTELLDTVFRLPEPPLAVAGGSLTARNEGVLLDRYPKLLIARGAGEVTMQDILAYWHGDLPLNQVQGIGYSGEPRGEAASAPGARRRRTAKPTSRARTGFLPELDLLPATFEHHGVAQLETSRGCTSFCSFCPRGHKGQWSGASPDGFSWILREMGSVFDRYPSISRTLYLVDEEFIGRGPDAVPRALAMGQILHSARFA